MIHLKKLVEEGLDIGSDMYWAIYDRTHDYRKDLSHPFDREDHLYKVIHITVTTPRKEIEKIYKKMMKDTSREVLQEKYKSFEDGRFEGNWNLVTVIEKSKKIGYAIRTDDFIKHEMYEEMIRISNLFSKRDGRKMKHEGFKNFHEAQFNGRLEVEPKTEEMKSPPAVCPTNNPRRIPIATNLDVFFLDGEQFSYSGYLFPW